MNDDVLVHVGERRFIVTMEEAMQVCSILCSASRITREWSSAESKSVDMIAAPEMSSAYITPFTAILKLECEVNQKAKEAKK